MKDYLKKLHTAAFSGTAILMDLIASQYGATPCDLAHPYALIRSKQIGIYQNLYTYKIIEKYHGDMLRHLIKKSNKIKSSKDGKNGEKRNKGKSYMMGPPALPSVRIATSRMAPIPILPLGAF